MIYLNTGVVSTNVPPLAVHHDDLLQAYIASLARRRVQASSIPSYTSGNVSLLVLLTYSDLEKTTSLIYEDMTKRRNHPMYPSTPSTTPIQSDSTCNLLSYRNFHLWPRIQSTKRVKPLHLGTCITSPLSFTFSVLSRLWDFGLDFLWGFVHFKGLS